LTPDVKVAVAATLVWHRSKDRRPCASVRKNSSPKCKIMLTLCSYCLNILC